MGKLIAEREAEAVALNQAVRDKDVHIGNIEQAANVRNDQIASLTLAEAQKNQTIQQLHASTTQLHYRLDRARAGLGWKLAKPLRIAKGLWRRFTRKLSVDMIPLAQLERSGDGWRASGDDPQFLLMSERTWHGLAGWYWLEIETRSDQPLNARLYIDIGNGFDPAKAISFILEGGGVQRIPVYVPRQCQAIRLDPCDTPTTFRLSIRKVTALKDAPELPEEFAAQFAVHERLGGRTGNAANLVPVYDISHGEDNQYTWRAVGADPWFVIKDFVQRLRPGWYMVELCIRVDAGHGNAKFYFDYGAGYSELAALAMPFSTGQTVKRLVHLENTPRQIRFDPIDCAARFSIQRIHFAPVTPAFARIRILRRLRNRNAKYKDFALWHVWQDIKKYAKRSNAATIEILCRRYDETYSRGDVANGTYSYGEWIAAYETPVHTNRDTIDTAQQNFEYRPTISVVVPAYNTTEIFLRKAIDSVIGQSYPNWELCIADDASPKPHVRAVLEEYARQDSRIKVTFRPENGHISAASNSALELATGDFVALLDHDDELSPFALHFVVEAINRNPSVKIIYTDEDKIDEGGNRLEPHFKSDWNPDLFYSQNYVSHLGVYRRELIERIGGFRAGVEGSQDQDLLLRCLPHVNPSEIVHVPKVLYHWRMVEGSTALASGEKSYTTEAGIKALRDYFGAQGQNGVRVEAGVVPNTYRVRYPIPQPEPLVSLLIPTRDMLELLEPCVRSILAKTTYQNYEILILDNESVQAATLAYFERIQAADTRVRVLPYHYPFNYSAINNYGVKHAKGGLIGLVNNDIEVISPEWLTEMVSHVLRPEIGCVGAKLYYADNTIQHAGVILGIGGVANHHHKHFPKESHGYFARLSVVQNFSAVTAACLLVRKTIYEEIGGLEEDFLKVAFNDVDFCLKVREAGYRNLWTPYAELYHHESKSRGSEDTPEKHARFVSEVLYMQEKWKDQLALDPMYSPNLTHEKDDFSINNHL